MTNKSRVVKLFLSLRMYFESKSANACGTQSSCTPFYRMHTPINRFFIYYLSSHHIDSYSMSHIYYRPKGKL